MIGRLGQLAWTIIGILWFVRYLNNGHQPITLVLMLCCFILGNISVLLDRERE